MMSQEQFDAYRGEVLAGMDAAENKLFDLGLFPAVGIAWDGPGYVISLRLSPDGAIWRFDSLTELNDWLCTRFGI